MKFKSVLLAIIIASSFTTLSLTGCGDKEADSGEEAEDLEVEGEDEPSEENEEEGE